MLTLLSRYEITKNYIDWFQKFSQQKSKLDGFLRHRAVLLKSTTLKEVRQK